MGQYRERQRAWLDIKHARYRSRYGKTRWVSTASGSERGSTSSTLAIARGTDPYTQSQTALDNRNYKAQLRRRKAGILDAEMPQLFRICQDLGVWHVPTCHIGFGVDISRNATQVRRVKHRRQADDENYVSEGSIGAELV